MLSFSALSQTVPSLPPPSRGLFPLLSPRERKKEAEKLACGTLNWQSSHRIAPKRGGGFLTSREGPFASRRFFSFLYFQVNFFFRLYKFYNDMNIHLLNPFFY